MKHLTIFGEDGAMREEERDYYRLWQERAALVRDGASLPIAPMPKGPQITAEDVAALQATIDAARYTKRYPDEWDVSVKSVCDVVRASRQARGLPA